MGLRHAEGQARHGGVQLPRPAHTGAGPQARHPVPRRHADGRGRREVQPRPWPAGCAQQHQGRPAERGAGRCQRPVAGDDEAGAARHRAARHSERPRRHDGLAQGGSGAGRRARPQAGGRRAVEVRQLVGQREDRGHPGRQVLARRPRLRRRHRVLDHPRAGHRAARGGGRAEPLRLPSAAAADAADRQGQESAEGDRPHAVLPAAVLQPGQEAAGQPEGAPGDQPRTRPQVLRQGVAGRRR